MQTAIEFPLTIVFGFAPQELTRKFSWKTISLEEGETTRDLFVAPSLVSDL